MEPAEEAGQMLQALHDEELGHQVGPGNQLYPGLVIDGKTAIIEMKKASYPFWKEMEWPSYFIRFLLEHLLEGEFQITTEKKRTLFSKEYVWDVRVRADHSTDKVILTDVRNIDSLFSDARGFGLIIIDCDSNLEINGEFRAWQEHLTGLISKYAWHRRRKTHLFLMNGFAYFFPTLNDFRSGIKGNWLEDQFGRNLREPDGSPRNFKYRIALGGIPEQYQVTTHTFNLNPKGITDELQEDE